MYGLGILKGLFITIRHAWETYWDDLRWWGHRYFRPDGIAHRRSKSARGIFTVQYPEERLPLPEAFRVFPFLIYEETDAGRKLRCTACGICARVCPPQCIWIVRAADPASGKPRPMPEQFNIEIDLCMNCGLCAEFCPFDAIKMDHDFELAGQDRRSHVFGMERLAKPEAYFQEIRPKEFQNARIRRETRMEHKG